MYDVLSMLQTRSHLTPAMAGNDHQHNHDDDQEHHYDHNDDHNQYLTIELNVEKCDTE
jgi:hypothetical protein